MSDKIKYIIIIVLMLLVIAISGCSGDTYQNNSRIFEREYFMYLYMPISAAILILLAIASILLFIKNNRLNKALFSCEHNQINEMKQEIGRVAKFNKSILEFMPVGIAIFGYDPPKVIDCNDKLAEMFNATKQHIIDRFFEDFSPQYLPDGKSSYNEAIGILNRAKAGEIVRVEWPHQTSEGEPVPCELTLMFVKDNEEFLGLGFLYDLRDMKNMSHILNEQSGLFKVLSSVSSILLDPDFKNFDGNLLNSMSIMAKAMKVDRVCIWKNYPKDGRQYCTRVYEWMDDEAIKQAGRQKVEDISYDANLPGCEEILSQGKNLNSAYDDVPQGTKDQLLKWGIVAIFVVPVFVFDTFWGFVGFEDFYKERIFTENEEVILCSASRMIANALIRNEMTQNIRNAADRMEIAVMKEHEASVAKSDFLAKMSHEIRTPMNAVIGMAELALREKEMDAIRSHLFTIKNAGGNLLSIINDILDFSKIESGKLEIISDYYQFSSLLNDVISIIRMRAVDSQLRFVVTVDSNIPNELCGDEVRVRQILINILGNAVKYTEKGFISFTVTGQIIDDETINLAIDIMDSGKGIKQEDISKLFNEFVKLDTAQNKSIEGTGLGLAITWNIIKAMGGDIQVFSEYGKGSTFSVTLPQKFRVKDKLASVNNPEDKNVIVFERRDIYANSIVATVDNLGVSCEIASSIDEFSKKLASKRYSFIFIASGLYEHSKQIISEFGKDSKIVLLIEFGESVPDSGWSILAMPAHSMFVANVLNGVSDGFFYKENDESLGSFTAPDAQVLVVDDIKTNLMVAEGLLMPYKMQVDLCKSGIDAIRTIQSKQYDLVFMDHWMPEMDGVEVTNIIRGLAGGDSEHYYSKLPIIALTANAISGNQDMFLENGLNGFLAKPIDTTKLNNILEKWIPKNKRKIITFNDGADTSSEKKQKLSAETLKIEGLDIKNAISLTGASVERYLETLKVFYDDGLEKIKEIKTALEANNIPLYTIHIHAIKSASANIGAEKLSEKASALEAAGKQADLSYIGTHNSQFLTDFELLLNSINDALSVLDESREEKKDPVDMKEVKIIFGKLKTAIEAMDAQEMDSNLALLLKLNLADNISEGLQTISKQILMADYDEALSLLEFLLSELNSGTKKG